MTTEAQEWAPAFPGQRRPFPAGHTLSVRSGAFSDRFIGPLALEIAQQLVEEWPEAARHPHLLASTARLGARVALLNADLDATGHYDAKGKLREGPLRWAAQYERQYVAGLRELGLSPVGEARLQRDRALAAATVIDLHAVRQAGDEHAARFLAQRDRALAASVEDGSTGDDS